MTTVNPNYYVGIGSRNEMFDLGYGNLDHQRFIDGKGGNDYIHAVGYSGRLIGGFGNDLVFGTGTLFGDLPDEVDAPTTWTDEFGGAVDNDTLVGGSLGDNIFGSRGNDVLFGQGGNDNLSGGTGHDKVSGGYGSDSISGGDGHDMLFAGGMPDFWIQDYRIIPPEVAVTHNGINDQEFEFFKVISFPYNNVDGQQNGENDADTVNGGDGHDEIVLNGGADRAFGGTGNDHIFGGSGNNFIDGDTGDDYLPGGGGADTLYAGAGDDWIDGGAGNDRITGGSGKDEFWLTSKPSKSTNMDTITDFTVKDDIFVLENAYFKVGASFQAMSSKMFVKGKKAKDSSDRIIYDQKSGALYYDADGTGKAAQIKIAQLDKSLAMTFKDFWVV